MVTPLVKPGTLLQPFANDPASRNTIPNTPDATPGHASLDIGFPPLTRTPIQSGGKPPAGKDMNGLGYLISSHSAWVAAGGQYTFDAALATFTGGYKLGAVLQSDDGLSSYRSMVANNTDNFNTNPSVIGVSWEPYAGQALNGSQITVTTTGGNTNLTATQAAAAIINVTGTLTSNATLTFPVTAVKSWRITNSTTGAFSLSAKIAAGAALTLTQGKSNTLFYNGVNLVFPSWDSGLDSPAFRGVPTAPTAAPLNNSNQLATTAYVDAAGAALVLGLGYRYVNSAITASGTGDLWTDTSAGGFTINLPDPPIGNNLLQIRDIGGQWDRNNLIINPGTKTIRGVAGNLICNISGESFGMWYDTVNSTWRVI